ncbi:hypothetical protein V5O48_008727 [Marasmius crinis-equi]|uniref:Uncharacterized protein n=1 Tax=Marasmius crinis-equi TaxID=585013 RepID=A0ABR3FDC9_9AGAR
MSATTAIEASEQQPMEKIPEDAEVIDLTALSDGSSGEEEDEEDDGSEAGSSDDDEEPVINANSRNELRVALETVPATRLQEIIMALVVQIPAVERALTREFVGPNARDKVYKRQREEDDDVDQERIERCAKCHEEYDAGVERESEECVLHPGVLKPNYQMFVDWDEEVHGAIDSEETRKEFPANFLWSCCNEDGVSSGCVKTKHEPATNHNKRRRTDED